MTRRDQLFKWAVYALGLLPVWVLDAFVLSRYPLFGVTPILLPVATALGVNPVHFGILMTMNLAVGFITPPYGVNLFVGSSVARIPFERVVKWIWPLIGTILVVLLLTTYVPQLSLLLV